MGGKLLNPQNQTEINLPSLCVGKQVLRTKLLEGGGNDGILDGNDLPKDDPIRDGRDKMQSNHQNLDVPNMKIQNN